MNKRQAFALLLGLVSAAMWVGYVVALSRDHSVIAWLGCGFLSTTIIFFVGVSREGFRGAMDSFTEFMIDGDSPTGPEYVLVSGEGVSVKRRNLTTAIAGTSFFYLLYVGIGPLTTFACLIAGIIGLFAD